MIYFNIPILDLIFTLIPNRYHFAVNFSKHSRTTHPNHSFSARRKNHETVPFGNAIYIL